MKAEKTTTHKKRGRPSGSTKKAVAQVPPQEIAHVLEFKGKDAALYEGLVAVAKYHRRNVNDELLVMVQDVIHFFSDRIIYDLRGK